MISYSLWLLLTMADIHDSNSHHITGVECDIAMLDVEDEGFWNGVPPLELGPLPRLQDSVAVVGYPVGGDTISVTAGVVSRIEVTDYSHGSSDLLAIQIDAAINGGNSGGPVFNRSGQCVGIAFQVSIKRRFLPHTLFTISR